MQPCQPFTIHLKCSFFKRPFILSVNICSCVFENNGRNVRKGTCKEWVLNPFSTSISTIDTMLKFDAIYLYFDANGAFTRTELMVCSHCLSPDTGTGTGKKWVVWYHAERFTLHRDRDNIVSYCAGPGPCSGFGPGVSQCEQTIRPRRDKYQK